MRVQFLFFAASATALPWLPWDKRSVIDRIHGRQVEAPPPAANVFTDDPLGTPHWDKDTFTLCTTQLVQNHFQATPYVANGYFGQRFAAAGHGFQTDMNITDPDGPTQPTNGWPLFDQRVTFGTVSGFWDSQPTTPKTNFPEIAAKGGESTISGLPHWASLFLITPEGEYYGPNTDNSTISNFKQCMSLRNGLVTTSLTWKPSGGASYDLKRASVGYVQLDVTASEDAKVSVADVLDGAAALRTIPNGKGTDEKNTIWSSVHPEGLSDVSAWVYSIMNFKGSTTAERSDGSEYEFVSKNESTIAQAYSGVELKANQKFTFTKHVGIASTDAFPQTAQKVAMTQAQQAASCGYKKLYDEHCAAWDAIWDEGSILAEYDDELQIGIQASLFHILSSLRSDSEGKGFNDNSISVGGLSSDSYAGMVFWDADLWVFPGIAPLWPDLARPILNYRSRLLPQSEKNAQEAGYGLDTAAQSWTSARFGNCTGTGPCFDYQYHLNADTAFAFISDFYNTGDKEYFLSTGWPAVRKFTNFFTQYVKFVNGSYHTLNMTDPDEYANQVNDGAFTNISIKKLLQRALELAPIAGYTPPKNWSEIEEQLYIPYDTTADLIPEYTGMNGSLVIKQVDVVLAQYPVGFTFNDTQARNDLYWYAKAQSPDGPAMTWSIYSIVSSSLIETGCQSWTYAMQNGQTYLRAPWYQFSEQVDDDTVENGGTNPAFPFLTGHGGYVQVWAEGYSGFRSAPDAFYLNPSLPPHMTGGLKLRTLKWQGATFEVDIQQDGTTVTRLANKNKTMEYQGAAPVKIGKLSGPTKDYTLNIGEKIKIPTRLPHKNPPLPPGNVAQCTPVTSNVTFAPGMFPIAAVDGSNATAWQPRTVDPSSITVDLAATFPPPPGSEDTPAEMRKIHGMTVVWGMEPAKSFKVEMSNTSYYNTATEETDENVGNWVSVYMDDVVEISEAFNATKYKRPVIEAGNVTEVSFDKSFTGRFVRLTIEGNQNPQKLGFGATVAEWIILGDMTSF